MEQKKDAMLSAILVHLLKGVIYRDKNPDLWQGISFLHGQLLEQTSILGLEFVIDENEGYAFCKQRVIPEGDVEIPRLVQRRQLSYMASLLCVLLRKKMVESDAGGELSRVILTREQIVDMMRLYSDDSGNEAKTVDRIDTAVRKLIELGFIRIMDTQKDAYELRRILKAFIDADFLSSLDEKLKSYREYTSETDD